MGISSLLMVGDKDPDLEKLRSRPEWSEAVSKMRGGMTDKMRTDMITELRSPFRLFRFWVLGSLSIGASVGLIFIAAKLVKAIQRTTGFQILGE